jgi:hypothetical protein
MTPYRTFRLILNFASNVRATLVTSDAGLLLPRELDKQ